MQDIYQEFINALMMYSSPNVVSGQECKLEHFFLMRIESMRLKNRKFASLVSGKISKMNKDEQKIEPLRFNALYSMH
jgi:hypothetical protein